MPYFREVNTGQVVEVTGEHRTAKFSRLARWEEIDNPPAKAKAATAKPKATEAAKDDVKPAPRRRRSSAK